MFPFDSKCIPLYSSQKSIAAALASNPFEQLKPEQRHFLIQTSKWENKLSSLVQLALKINAFAKAALRWSAADALNVYENIAIANRTAN